jgi:hypothetical protein
VETNPGFRGERIIVSKEENAVNITVEEWEHK